MNSVPRPFGTEPSSEAPGLDIAVRTRQPGTLY